MDINAALGVIVASASATEAEEERQALAAYLAHLLTNDFAALVQTLYRVDVSEQKLKAALKENPSADAGDLLAELLVQRQKEKAAQRQTFRVADKPQGDEAW